MKIRVGMGSCGIAAGALELWNKIEKEPVIDGIAFTPIKTGCAGMCYGEPLVDLIDDEGNVYTYGQVDEKKLAAIVKAHHRGEGPLTEYLLSLPGEAHPFTERQVRIALRNCGIIDPESIDDYLETGGYQALARVLASMTPEQVIEEMKTSGLRGRGGAGFPTWFKWQATRIEAGNEKYIVCNADEGDPGAFMDRSVLEGDPHSVLEGMAIAAYATGARHGIIYCRAEYPLAIKRLEIAIQAARHKGWLGDNIKASGFHFDIRIKQGAGAFVCGEETALIASLEGERGMPRLKPPYPSQRGYRAKPTSINNVETLANVPWIIHNGGEAFAAMGTEQSKGTKVFALAGKIARGGLVEVPMGITLGEIIFDIGGGIKNNREFKAVQLGGPSGGCVPADLLHTPVDYDSITRTGAIMGSGGMIVVDESTCMVDMARYFLEFTQKESCGKCVQCRIGTKRMLETLERICSGKGQESDLDLLEELAARIKEASLCGLGQSAPNPVLTTIQYFREEYEAHIRDKKCPAKQCKELITFTIDADKCKGCTLCAKRCPVQCIQGAPREVHVIDQNRCIKCGNCLEVCPPRFNAVIVE